jgi:hypothetical protein
MHNSINIYKIQLLCTVDTGYIETAYIEILTCQKCIEISYLTFDDYMRREII